MGGTSFPCLGAKSCKDRAVSDNVFLTTAAPVLHLMCTPVRQRLANGLKPALLYSALVSFAFAVGWSGELSGSFGVRVWLQNLVVKAPSINKTLGSENLLF